MPTVSVIGLATHQIIEALRLVDAAQPLLQPRLELLGYLPHELPALLKVAWLIGCGLSLHRRDQ